MKKPVFPARLAALVLPLAAIPAFAQTSLPVVVISASRSQQRLQDAIPATTLITREEIERAATPDLPTLLRRVAGVEIAQNGGPGTVASAFIRGADSRHTLVLIDGVPINNLNFGTAALEHLPLADVERIEIVRGNVSSLYGSAALGGVIQIFTRQAGLTPQASVAAQVGSRGLAQLTVSGATRLESGTRLRASVESLSDKGFNTINQAERPGTNPDRDGYTRRSASLGVTQELAGGHSVGLRLRDARGKTAYDSQFGPATQADESRFAESGATLEGQFRLSGNVDLNAALTSSSDKLDAGVTAFPSAPIRSARARSWRWTGRWHRDNMSRPAPRARASGSRATPSMTAPRARSPVFAWVTAPTPGRTSCRSMCAMTATATSVRRRPGMPGTPTG